jgi:hypothetical protein
MQRGRRQREFVLTFTMSGQFRHFGDSCSQAVNWKPSSTFSIRIISVLSEKHDLAWVAVKKPLLLGYEVILFLSGP